MAFLHEFRCDVCGRVTDTPVHWLVIHSDKSHVTMVPWDAELAQSPGAAHICGEADAQIYLSRWLDSPALRSKTLPFPGLESVRAPASDIPANHPCRERRRTPADLPVRESQEQTAFQRS